MTAMPPQQAELEAKPSSSREPILKKNAYVEKLRQDYPNSIRPPSPNPLRKTQSVRLAAAAEVRRRLGLTDHDVLNVPTITPKIKSSVGTVRRAVRIIEGDDSLDSLKFMEKWNSLSPTDRKRCRIEDVITAAGLTTRRFMELLAGASFEHSAIISRLIVSRHQPRVLKATIKAATYEAPIIMKNTQTGEQTVIGHAPADVKAMEIFHKITGALPTPKGAQITLNQTNQTATIEATPERQALSSMDSYLMEIEDVRRPKQLHAPVEPIIPVEMPEGAPEIEYLSLEE